ncbi:MAG TPA: hypothetical protein VF746_05030 [Longimicrobium sp.]|jgi:hypothetical protein
MRRTARFLRAFLRGGAHPGVRALDVAFEVDGEPREALLYLPPERGPAPAWVVMPGITVHGRHHPAMTRFARSLAASGAVVLAPEVPAWSALRVDSAAARRTLSAAILHLDGRPEVLGGHVGAIGFSFGATQTVIAAADPALHGHLRAVLGFGGYCDLGAALRCNFTGEHEWRGVRYALEPDPYGRWVVVGNFATAVPGMEHMGALARAALTLAVEAGHFGAWAWDPVYDARKAELRSELSPGERRIWDVVAGPAGAPVDAGAARELADAFAAAALACDPGLDPRPHLPNLHGRLLLTHGRQDRLIPFTETLRLTAMMPPHVDVSTTITGLFAHSAGAWLHPAQWARETGRFVGLLNRALNAV